ncbi:hypothetical protein ACFSQ7_17670 [Paenibacillus rhizoplanae]
MESLLKLGLERLIRVHLIEKKKLEDTITIEINFNIGYKKSWNSGIFLSGFGAYIITMIKLIELTIQRVESEKGDKKAARCLIK